MLREGMFIADRYEILEKIGSGGMSDVYKAKCHKLNRYVAIKVLKPEFCEDKTFVSKFRVEAQSAAGLIHSNIVNVYDTGEENGIYYIVMELVEGITLKKYIEKKGKLGVREAVSVAIQVAQGIETAHKHHIVHRDIKPQNIIISKEGKVKVTDFGIARAASSNTINSAVMGSVHYISPEQARGGYSDEKSDIYSFGITLFEMLTGRVPFEGDTTVAVALQHIQDDMVSPKKYLPDIPVSVEKIVLKCTQKKTDRRYQNMTDLIADLKRSLVAPDEDFVVISAVVPDGITKMIDAEEIAEINERASKKSAEIDVVNTERDDRISAYAASDELGDEEDEEEAVLEEDEDDDRDTAASKKIDRVITILGIAVGVVILVITIIVIVKMVNLFSGGKSSSTKDNVSVTQEDDQNKVEVPKLLGYTYEQAKEELAKYNLGIKKIEDYSELYEEGQIYEQSVKAGEKVDKNTTIVVYVSKGTSTFEMPDVIGDTQTSAEYTLRNKNLTITYQYEETDDESKINRVASTDPNPGDTVKSGDTVTVTLYKGIAQKMAKVPDVTEKTKEDAESELRALGFVNIEYEYDYSDNVAEGKVVSQAGATVDAEAPVDTTTITLLVSRGPEPTEEPTAEEPETTKPAETTTEETTQEETEPETTAPAETEPVVIKVIGEISNVNVVKAIDDVDASDIKLEFNMNYIKEGSTETSTVTVATRTFENCDKISEAGIFKLSEDLTEIAPDAITGSVTITVEISYKSGEGTDEQTSVTGTAVIG